MGAGVRALRNALISAKEIHSARKSTMPSFMGCRALVLYGKVPKLMQEALTALHTAIPVLYQHGDFRQHCRGPIGVCLCH